MSDRVGQKLGNYKLLRLLGQGGFAEVYLGEHVHLGTFSAIKVLKTQLASIQDRDGFIKEARTVAHLVHSHIIRVTDFGIDDQTDTPFLVMDYAANGSLRERHPRGSILPIASIIPYIQQVASALQYAHNEKFVHRDIKPENMLLNRHNEVLLSDFGIALVAQSSHHQSTQDVVGTVAYMAPEQIQGKPRFASDQYSLAIVVYEWLTGKVPFSGSFTELCVQHMFAAPTPMRDVVPSITSEIEQVITIALAKEPKQRFASIQAFANALEQASKSISQANLVTEFKPLPPFQPSQPIPPVSIISNSEPVEDKKEAIKGIQNEQIAPVTADPYRPPQNSITDAPASTRVTGDAKSFVTDPARSGNSVLTPQNYAVNTGDASQAPPPPISQPFIPPYVPTPFIPPQLQGYQPLPSPKRPDGWIVAFQQIIAIVLGLAAFNIADHFVIIWGSDLSIYSVTPAIVILLFFSSAFGPWVGLSIGVLGFLIEPLFKYPYWVLYNGRMYTPPFNERLLHLSWQYPLVYGVVGLLIGLTGFGMLYRHGNLSRAGAIISSDLMSGIFLLGGFLTLSFIASTNVSGGIAISGISTNILVFWLLEVLGYLLVSSILLLIYSFFIPRRRFP